MAMPMGRESLMQNPDELLAERCRKGDLDAFAQIYSDYSDRVFRYAYHLLGHREDADDIKQETFVRAYQSIRTFRSEASMQTWLLKICCNLCRDRIKSWERRKVQYSADYERELLTHAVDTSDPHGIVERSQMLDTIMSALIHLPAAQREIVVLREIEELSYQEIGAILECSATSAKLRLFRARRALQQRVQSLLGL